jgi:DNA invertase Pin-like site-specific DNA recombinase
MQYMAQYIEYLRKSQMDRDFEELSVEETLKRHQQRLDEFTRQNKINVTVVLKEVVTGESLSGRPQMMKALELINTGEYDGIVCMDIDRLSRGSGTDSSYIMQVLQVNNCKIITPDKTYDLQNESDEQFADMKFMFSRYELRTISKRLMAGRNASVSEGKFVGSTPPYGYDIVKLKGEKGYTLKVNTDETRIVRLVYDLYTKDGMGYNTIAHHLNSLHIKTRKDRIWTQSHVSNILHNEVYKGKIRWKYQTQEKRMVDGKLVKKRNRIKDYEVYDGLHEPIITDEQWELAQKIRTERSHTSSKVGTELNNPFARLLRCEKCGNTLAHKASYNHRSDRFVCRQSGKLCDCKGNKAEEIENAIVTEMKQWLNGYLLALDTEETLPDDSLETALDILQKELDHLQEQQNNICELLERQIYTVELFTKRNDALQKSIDETKMSIENLKDQIIEQRKERIVQNNIIPTTQQLLDNYEMLTPREKNDLWKEVLHKITYYKNVKGGEFRITIYPKLQQNPPTTQ